MRAFEVVLWIGLAGIIQPVMSAISPTSKDCPPLKRYASIDMTMTSTEVFVPVTLEGKPALMKLNTQSGVSVMWKPAAREWGLPVRDLSDDAQGSFGKQRITQYTLTHSFSLGRLPFDGAQFSLAPAREGTESAPGAPPIIGILGMDFFENIDFELDFKNKRLNLYSQDHCPGAVVYWTDTYASTMMRRGPLGNAYFPMELEGKEIAATLATGSAITTLTTDVTKRLFGFDEHSEDIESDRDASGSVRSQYRAMALTAPGLKVTNTRVELLPQPGICHLQVRMGHAAQYTDCIGAEAPLHLGLSVLRNLHLYFATKENVLYYSAADAAFASNTEPAAASGH